jgi:hypothetical protein
VKANITPADVVLPIPASSDGPVFPRAIRGMLVRFHQTLYVTEHFQWGVSAKL